MKKTNKTKRYLFSGLQLILLFAVFGSLRAQQRTWMLPYYRESGAVTVAGGVNTVPVISFRTGAPTYETRYLSGSYSTQAVGNGEYCNNCAADQLTRLSEFFISGRSADSYQGNTNSPNPLRTMYAKWDQICGDTTRVFPFLTTGGADLAHESLNEIAVGDGENPGTFWVVMQQSPAGTDGFGPGFYVYLMDMNNASMAASTILQIDNAHFPANIPVNPLLGEGVALGPKFRYIMQPGETNANLIALNGQFCRSVYIASATTIYHFLINLSTSTLVFSDFANMTGTSGGNMFMEIDLNYPVNGRHPSLLGLTGWGGVYMYNVSTDHGKILATTNPIVTTSVGGYGLEFDNNSTNMYYSTRGLSSGASLFRVLTTAINFTTTITSASVTVSPALGSNQYNTNNYLALESAIDGNIYGITGNQEIVTIVDPELSPSTVTSATFNPGVFQNPVNGAFDLNPTLNTNMRFGLSLPDWVDGEVPLMSQGGTIQIVVPCAMCNDATVHHGVDIFSGTGTSETLIQHFNMLPCDTMEIRLCPGITYHVVFDEGLPTEQDAWITISFPGDFHQVVFNPYGSNVNYIQYNTNTTITTNTLWDNKVYIGPGVIVTVAAGVTLDITNVDVIFGWDAGIDFKDGAVIRANNSVFRPCSINDVWRSLAFFNTGSNNLPSGMINECTFKNAKTAIEAVGSTSPTLKTLDLRITNNLFADCQRGVSLNFIDFKRSISGNTYMIENKALPFSTINSAANPPKTFTPTNQNDYYGITTMSATFRDLIAQNDLVMASDSTNNDQMSYAISLWNSTFAGSIPTNVSTPTIASNKITDFSYGISTAGINKLSVENNELEWTNLYKKVIAAQYKFHIYANYGDNILIKGNKVYSANLLNQVSTNPVNDGGTGGPSTPQYKSVGITANSCNNVVIKQNEITGIESGIVAIGNKSISGVVNKNVYIAENEIKKSWYYGIYVRSYENMDIACNEVDMELKTGKDATGIGYFNLATSNGYANPARVALRSNCVLNTKNAIYAYSPSGVGTANMPRVYNNFCYNYTRVGFENNGLTNVNTVSPFDLHRNSFISNNSNSGLADVISNSANPISADYNYGVMNIASPNYVSFSNSNAGNSTASCGGQSSTNANILNSLVSCEYFYPSQSSWNPNGKVTEWVADPHDYSIVTEEFTLSDPIYGEINATMSANQSLFDMYPVPATDNISIAYDLEKADNAYLEFIDIQGRILKTVALDSDHTTIDVNVSEFNAGIYIVKLINAGKNIQCSKLIKQ